FCGFCSLDTTGHYFDKGLDSPLGRKALANAAPCRVSGRRLRGNSLLLAGKVRCSQAGLLWRACGGFTPVALGRLVAQTQPFARSQSENQPRMSWGTAVLV